MQTRKKQAYRGGSSGFRVVRLHPTSVKHCDEWGSRPTWEVQVSSGGSRPQGQFGVHSGRPLHTLLLLNTFLGDLHVRAAMIQCTGSLSTFLGDLHVRVAMIQRTGSLPYIPIPFYCIKICDYSLPFCPFLHTVCSRR